MDVLAAYREVCTYRGAAVICGTTHKTVKRIVDRHNAGGVAPERKERVHNYDDVRETVAKEVDRTHGKISAKRLLPAARAAGYEGSTRNFRRLVAEVKREWRRGHHRGRRPAVWTPGDTLVIDWGSRMGCTCSAPCWRGHGGGLCAWPPTRKPRRRWPCWPSASRPSVVSRRSCLPTDGVLEVGGGREPGGADGGLRPLRHKLRGPAGLLSRQRPGVQGSGCILRSFGWLS
jgi:hypothetical protein